MANKKLRALMNIKLKLDNFTQQQIHKHAKSLIVPGPKGSLAVYGKYLIKKTKQKFSVCTWDRQHHEFVSQRSALAWCTAQYHDCFNLANDIVRLDQFCDILDNDVWLTKQRLTQRSGSDWYDVLEAKLSHKQSRLDYLKNELENCLIKAKYIGLKDFNNEPARIVSV